MDMMVLTFLTIFGLTLLALGSFEVEQYRLRHRHAHR